MLIEAIQQPIRFRARDGKEFVLPLRTPVDVPDAVAQRIVDRAGKKVRIVRRGVHDWLMAWRELAEVTSGLTAEDPRLTPVLEALDGCDAAFIADDWEAFEQAREGVRRAMQGASAGGRR